MIQRITALFLKDLLLEYRLRESAILLFTLGVLTAVILSLGFELSFASSEVVRRQFPSLIWVLFVLVSPYATSRSLEYEFETRAIDGVLLSGGHAHEIFISKWLASSFLLWPAHLVISWVVSLLLNVPFSPSALFALLSLAAVLGYSALTTLLGTVAQYGRMRGMLLPVLLLPLMLPLFFCATECSHQLLSEGVLNFSGDPFLFLLLADTVYIALGVSLFEFVARD